MGRARLTVDVSPDLVPTVTHDIVVPSEFSELSRVPDSPSGHSCGWLRGWEAAPPWT